MAVSAATVAMEKQIIILFSFIIMSFSPFSLGQNKTPDYWKCENRISGKWVFGVAPSACDVKTFGDPSYVEKTYGPIVFDEKTDYAEEQTRYLQELGAVIKEAATEYIKKRNPAASEQEIFGFSHAILTMAHQESYWTHFRQPLNKSLKMMRGDYGHGHGLMQVDDRWHFLAVTKGTGWKLIDNVLYSLEEFYSGWEKAKDASCVKNINDYRERARAAYSAYNGGPSKICRWSNPNDKWAANDKGYIQKYDQELWLSGMKDESYLSKVNVPCLIEGNESCSYRSGKDSLNPQNGIFYLRKNDQQGLCRFLNSEFVCIENMRDQACLYEIGEPATSVEASVFNEDWATSYQIRSVDRHRACIEKATGTLYPVGELIQLNRAINLRATPAGSNLAVIPKDTRLQLYDFELREAPFGPRYYQVFWKGQWGYIYGGTGNDYSSWIQKAKLPVMAPQWIARVGERVKVKASGGINLRSVPGSGAVILKVPRDTILKVDSLHFFGDSAEVYYGVSVKGSKGFIYSGQSLPEKSFPNWTQPLVVTGSN